MQLATLDLAIMVAYFVLVVGTGLWLSRKPANVETNARDYFLASNGLPWWAIGASLIAANISAEQIIGMSGSGYAMGLAIASYEWMAALTLILVAKYFLPIFLRNRIYTMPEFLELRFDRRVRIALAVFWLLLYLGVNLPTVAYLGALALYKIIGIDFNTAVWALLAFSALYSLWGGLKAVAWTDVIQVIVLVLGGVVVTAAALDHLAGGAGMWQGLVMLQEKVPQHFDMILSPDHPSFKDLPGVGVLIGGMWIANLFYWGCNQYITQRALAAPNIQEAQKGLVFAAYLKLFMPLIVVIPGIAVFALQADIAKPDEAYPWLLAHYAGPGIMGLALAALVAAIASSLASMVNSTATLFTMDVYKTVLKPDADDRHLVRVGRITGLIAIAVAALIAPMLSSLEQVFQYIQEFTGLISPGVFAIFILGLFWKPATAASALWAAVLALPVSLGMKFLLPQIAFLDRMMISFALLCAVVVVITLLSGKQQENTRVIVSEPGLFKTTPGFNLGALGVIAILWGLYTFLQ